MGLPSWLAHQTTYGNLALTPNVTLGPPKCTPPPQGHVGTLCSGHCASENKQPYEGGENETVTQYDDYVSFENKRGLISNAENNPADVVLTEEQKSMHNCAKWPRTILTAGISNKQWEGVVTFVANTASHGGQPNAKPDTQPNLSIFYRFGTVHCGVRLHQQPKLPWGLLCE